MITHGDPCPLQQRPEETTPLHPRAAGPREWIGLALLALPTLLIGLEVTLLHLVLPVLAVDLRPTSVQTLWIVDIYGFMIAGFLVTMGTLGDRIGRRRLMMIGAAGFAIASVIAAFSSSASMLIAARAALGVAGATLMPSTLALISNLFLQPRQRALAIGLWATVLALGMAAGPVVGGVLLAHYWWGAAFLIAVPIVALVLLGAPILLPEYRAPWPGRLDMPSVVLSLAALLPVIYGIKQLAKGGPGAVAGFAIIVGLVLMALFVRRQRRLASPLIDLGLFASRAFSVALGVLLVGLVGVGGTLLLVTQYLQLVAGLSPLAAGLWLMPPALAMLAAGIGAPLLARCVRPGSLIGLALLLSAVGYLMLARLDSGSGEIPWVIASFSLVYFGLGTLAALGTELVVSAAPADKAGSAAALSEMVQELGLALGIATLGSLAGTLYRLRMTTQLPGGLPPGVEDALVDSLAGAVPQGKALPAGLLEQAQDAFVAGFSLATTTCAIAIALLALLAAAMLRHVD
ncbi:MFS transporter [Stutzerimonas kirkiae]|uniref:MFS transporter n=1 Tax=Stutzerimonas kirkiae TaxID=2211392 RepID=UPI001F61B1D4|nr:MFS transporter [Stutzerimonas kirkiae]